MLNLIRDIGERPSRFHSIERVDPLKGYCKDNCEWVTARTQAVNRLAYTWSKSGYKNIRLVKGLWIMTVTQKGRQLVSWHKRLEDAIELRDLVREELGYRPAWDMAVI